MALTTQSIGKLGKAGETVKVAPGYFRNHLMPKLLAFPNIEKYALLVREQRKVLFCCTDLISSFMNTHRNAHLCKYDLVHANFESVFGMGCYCTCATGS